MSGPRLLSRSFSLPLVCALAVAGCYQDRPLGVSSIEPDGALAAAAPARPFRLTAEGHANPDFSLGPCNVVNTELGTGVAQHLGRVTWQATEVADFCVDPANPGLAAVSGQLVVTAANGDQLTASGQSTVHADFAKDTLTITGTFTITGGTGRFAGATGGGTVTGGGSLLPPFAVATVFEGRIAY